MDKYEMIYESICDLYDEGILTEEEANEVNDLAYEKYVEATTELENDPSVYDKFKKSLDPNYVKDTNMTANELGEQILRSPAKTFTYEYISKLYISQKHLIERDYNNCIKDIKRSNTNTENFEYNLMMFKDTLKRMNTMNKAFFNKKYNRELADSDQPRMKQLQKDWNDLILDYTKKLKTVISISEK